MTKTSLSILLAGLLCPAFATAQVTSPNGFLSTEGGTNHGYILGNRLGLTWQQIDASLRNVVFPAQSIAWRRDAVTAANTEFGARTMEVEIFLANSDLTKITTNHSANYVGTPTNVVTKKTVNAPDWTNPPTTTPAPFNFVVPFDTNYVHGGVWDFLWEVRVTKNSYAGSAFTNYPYDFHYVVPSGSFSAAPTASNNTKLGTGCTIGSAAFTHDTILYNHAIKFRLQQSVTAAPANAPIAAYIGLQDLNVPVPGWCERVRTDTTFLLPLGTSDATGSATSTIDNIKYDATLIGFPLYSQTFAPYSGSVALSNGVKFAAGTDPNYPKVGRVYSYIVGTGTTTSGPWTGGIVTRFQ
ncbi:MAG: hypothetical protein H6836_06425 [Planctomycetes bacterium]|nr:hypothetical protein [Planctomycetota bacterium]MCB9889195.1 hypothetical protein [Planctomycetota bacterium]